MSVTEVSCSLLPEKVLVAFFLSSLWLQSVVLLPLLLFNMKYRESIGKDERFFPNTLYLSMDKKWGNYFFVPVLNSFGCSFAKVKFCVSVSDHGWILGGGRASLLALKN